MRLLARFVALAMAVAIGICGSLLVGPADAASAVTGSDFRAGYIISDQVFFDNGTMSQAAIQSLLVSKEGGCTAAYGYPCLKDYFASTASRAASAGHCAAYPGAVRESASQIIYKVAQSCGINPQVILTLLEKEQGLVSSTAPTSWKYQAATGYGCPDTAACNSQYYGFYNQVYKAAWQFKEYVTDPGYWRYKVGNVAIQYSPSAGCGSSVVNIENAATAALYNYTPYQPNGAALANLRGVGDSCSSYGNRNFWVYFNDWFGTPTGQVDPLANLDYSDLQTTTSSANFGLSGWVLDRANIAATVEVDVYLDQPSGVTRGYALQANQSRPDVGAAYPGAGPNHGFSTQIPLTTPGTFRACLYPQVTGGPYLLGCKTVSVVTATPMGYLDAAQGDLTSGSPSITVSGWAFDSSTPSATSAIDISVQPPAGSSAKVVTVQANSVRNDVGSAYPSAGPNHGFTTSVPVTAAGTYMACATASNPSVFGPKTVSLGCKTVTMGASSPFGTLDYLTLSRTTATVSIDVQGWAIDRASPASSFPVDLYVDRPNGTSSGVRLSASASRPDVGAVYPFAGSAHGFALSVPVTTTGTYRVCAYAIGTSPFGNSSPQLGCRTITVAATSPIGYVDSASVTMAADGTRQIRVTGWTADPGLPTARVEVNAYLDRPNGPTLGFSTQANESRPDVAAAYPAFGAAHGFSYTLPVTASGIHRVCVYGLATSPVGGNSDLGCKTVMVEK